LTALHAQRLQSNTNTLLEAKVKAAYLFNFTKFVTWPSRPESTLSICVIGAPKIAQILKELSQTKPFHLNTKPDPKYSQCKILYIGSNIRDFDKALAMVKDKQILTVSDIDRFTQRGGIVGFVSELGRVRLEININMAQANHIEISSKLLELSKIVGLVE
jgi:hypothetical protein